ncbi:MAG: hypothetical protein OXC13_01040 [Caldilineaceae bacterium]|nr:hypothetical protein [Caldilineaceae bacterium]
MSHPKATGNRRSANQTLMDPINLWRECVQDAEGCYFDPVCRAPDLLCAHALSRGWLNTLADANRKVYWFSHREGLVPKLRKPLTETGATTTPDQAQQEACLDQTQRKAHPDLAPVDVATTAKFCCKTHDLRFTPIDELDVRSVLTPSDLNERWRNLMFHRAVIRQLYRDTAFKVYRRELRRRYPGQSFPWDDNPHWDWNSIENLRRARKILLEALNTKGSSWRVRHIVRHILGAPQVAACGVSSWGPDVWGCTVVPHAGGHLAAYHYCTTQLLPRAWEGLAQMERSSEAGMFRAAACQPRRISRFLLTLCKEVCLAPAAWHRWDAGKQDAVRDLFFSTITGDRFGGPPLAAIPDVNLFD